MVFFTRTCVKAQFLTAQSPSEVGFTARALSGATSDLLANSAQRRPQRPLSITIIAWVLLAGCILSPLNFLLHTPAIVLTKTLTGWAAALSYLTFAVIHFLTGWGLLRLRPWARQLGIALYGFGFINIVAFYITPGARGRFQALMGSQNSMFPWLKAIPNQPHFPFEAQPFLTLVALFGMAVIALPIYFLVTRRAAFE